MGPEPGASTALASRWLLGLLLLGLAALAIVAVRDWAGWSGPRAGLVQELGQARILAGPGPLTPGTTVALPHVWPASQQGQPLRYALAVPAGPLAQALLIHDTLPGLRVYWQGRELQASQITGRWNQSLVVPLPPAVATGSGGPSDPVDLALELPAHIGLRAGLGAVRVGPQDLVWRQAKVQSELRAASTAFTGNVLLAIVLMSLMAWMLWPRPELLVLLVAAGCNALNQNLLAWLGLWQGDDLHLAAWTLAGAGTALWIPLLLRVAAGLPWRRPLVAVLVVSAGGLGLQLSASLGWGPELVTRRYAVNLMVMPVYLWLVTSSLPTVWRRRDWVLLSIFGTLTVLWGLRLSRLLALDGELDFQGINLPLVLAPVLNLTIGLALAARGWRAVRRYRDLSLSLAQDVAQAQAELRASAGREQALAVREAASSERLHWMQEIHDGIGSQLMAARLLAARQPEGEGTTQMRQSIDDGIDQLRMIVESLSPSPQTAAALLGAVRYRFMPRLQALGIEMAWDVDPQATTRELDPRTALNLQRIVQEALTNILRHAGASRIRVELRAEGDAPPTGEAPRSLLIALEDNGRGLDASALVAAEGEPLPGGQGVANMHRRAQACGGTLRVSSSERGTRLELRLPGWA